MYQIFNKPIISSYLKSKRLEWAGHIWRSDGIAKNIFTGKLNGKRPRGRPRQRWEDRVKTDLKATLKTLKTVSTIVTNHLFDYLISIVMYKYASKLTQL